jgi:DNA-binding ferritin-like protein
MIPSKLALAREAPENNEPGGLVVKHLHKQVANAFILYANYKHCHWQAFGPFFRDLHLLFDDFANSVLATADEFAERLRERIRSLTTEQCSRWQESSLPAPAKQ